ncbi:MAG: hypothetical protein N3G21_12665 [Candidatus Hydrogenedentes bacterium]|nr:hypothetical protein [Candidatus Hydrogenedentota bacterium]
MSKGKKGILGLLKSLVGGRGRGVSEKPKRITRLAGIIGGAFNIGAGGYLSQSDNLPFSVLEVYRRLRDNVPDLADAVWTWKKLCETGFNIGFDSGVSEADKDRVRRVIAELDDRVNGRDGGMVELLDILYASLFTYGSAGLEIVFEPEMSFIYDVVPVDVWTIRFVWEEDRWQAYQVHADGAVRLPAERFLYFALDRDGTNPYGRSILRSLPGVVRIQQRLMEDMARAMHNAGWARMHIQYKPEERASGESEEEYNQRMEAYLEELRNELSCLSVDQNLITFDNIDVNVVQGSQRFPAYYETQRAIEEQIITGTHLMPILLGRNYGTTETYGTVQYEIINRQVDAINLKIARGLERIYNLELSLAGINVKVRVIPKSNRSSEVLKQAYAEANRFNLLLKMFELGVLSKEELRSEMERSSLMRLNQR